MSLLDSKVVRGPNGIRLVPLHPRQQEKIGRGKIRNVLWLSDPNKYRSWIRNPFAQRVIYMMLGITAASIVMPIFLISRTQNYTLTHVLNHVVYCPSPDYTAEERLIFRHHAYMNDWLVKYIGGEECYDPPGQ